MALDMDRRSKRLNRSQAENLRGHQATGSCLALSRAIFLPPPTLDPRPVRRLDRGMKAILLSLFVGLLMVGCGEVVDSSKLQDRDGVTYLPNEETPFTGRAESFYGNGQKESEENYKDGKADGLWSWWYENGQKKAEINYKDGIDRGLATAWYENGQKKSEENVKYGKYHGLWTRWYENGQKKWEENYKDGKLISAESWKPNGEKCPVTNLKGGNGVWVSYNDDGTEYKRYSYKDGERVFD